MKLWAILLTAALTTFSLINGAQPAIAAPVSWGLDRLDQPPLIGE
jgi:hypothetical protein